VKELFKSLTNLILISVKFPKLQKEIIKIGEKLVFNLSISLEELEKIEKLKKSRKYRKKYMKKLKRKIIENIEYKQKLDEDKKSGNE